MPTSTHPPAKCELLKHYRARNVRAFIQFDNWGDSLIYGRTYDLMTGSPLRVIIPPTTTRELALRLLEEIRRTIEERFEDGPLGEVLPQDEAVNLQF